MTPQKDKKNKKPFDWNAGSKLTPEHYDAVDEVREAGFEKLADGLYADPAQRREARKKTLTRKAKAPKEGEFILEESTSGLKGEFTPSDASRLIHKDREHKGIQRFQKKTPGKNEPD